MLLGSVVVLLPFAIHGAFAAPSWSFEDATVAIQKKGAGAGSQAVKEKLSPSNALSTPLTLGSRDTLKVLLTAKEGPTPKRPHQAFLIVQDQTSGLEDSFPLTVKDNGKAKVEITHKELPTQLLTASSPLKATLILASFGSSSPLSSQIFSFSTALDQTTPLQLPPAPLRYGKLPEIPHIFRDDPKSPNILITAVFAIAVVATLPILAGVYLELGMNFSHAKDAFGTAAIAHGLFFGSLLALEAVFVMYYVKWNLFQTVPIALGVGVVAFLSGSRALSEVQERRIAGKR